jgi:hypothetical protein
VQAEKYWPEVNEEVKFSPLKISITTKAQDLIDADITKTIVLIKGPEGEKVVEHIHVQSLL